MPRSGGGYLLAGWAEGRLLDWFHITMRITVMTQLAKGLRTPTELSVSVVEQLQRLKWFLWHGNVFRALQSGGSSGRASHSQLHVGSRPLRRHPP